MAVNDVARFRSYDPPEIVSASFACPYCLHPATNLLLQFDDSDGTARSFCTCDGCVRAWVVDLDGGQALRVAVDPPPAARVRTTR